MDEMREIVTQEQVEHLFLMLAVAGPAAGALIGALVALCTPRTRGRPGIYALRGVLWGLLGTVNWLLWRLYNAITAQLGLDTVANLLVNLVLFAALGCAAGWIYSRRRRGVPS
ncbi:MAG: hypothetical protein ACP5VE_08900 [Chthonomonadales bacterium]